jgi:hydroxylaminobenzene mutase
MRPDRALLRAGFLLVLLALVTGFAIPAFRNPKMALGAHLTGVMNGLLLVALAVAWSSLRQGPGRARLTRGLMLYAAYVNWGGTCLAAAWGTSRLTPINGAGFTSLPWQEAVVQSLQVSLALAIVAGLLLVVHGLRPAGEEVPVGAAAAAT